MRLVWIASGCIVACHSQCSSTITPISSTIILQNLILNLINHTRETMPCCSQYFWQHRSFFNTDFNLFNIRSPLNLLPSYITLPIVVLTLNFLLTSPSFSYFFQALWRRLSKPSLHGENIQDLSLTSQFTRRGFFSYPDARKCMVEWLLCGGAEWCQCWEHGRNELGVI